MWAARGLPDGHRAGSWISSAGTCAEPGTPGSPASSGSTCRARRCNMVDPIVETRRQARADRCLRREDVANLAAITVAALGSYERGVRTPPLPVLRRWAAAFGYQVTLAGAGEVAGG